ncbi:MULTISPECIES: efflux transporter outer membrane subunit [Enterobacterales]|uniref:Efflux transporter outer membrane subunit n=1 Tax=Enterobacter ludwigii TaxID=299767 RepID=A0AAX3LJ87_9ENTR|nr:MULTISPECIES: efflux transporter outer membrane subunit [Enterobacterales]MDU6439480.1 efflux transporter outer membrane subunit [Pantoea sp.]WCE16373.1 efflux transporter outer membrane subunit [Enterobacter ludwigii]
MNNCFSTRTRHPLSAVAAVLAITLISGCTVGPDFKRPTAEAPNDWTTWRSGDAALHALPGGTAVSDNQWWKRYNDPVLSALVDKALTASPDIRSATLRFASARAQQQITASQQTPTVNATGSVTRMQQSENAPSTRALKEALPNPDELIELMAAPSNWYQGGLDFSWEIDLWGHVRRAVEASDADVQSQQAMLELARLSIVGDVVNNYYNLRGIQQQIQLAKQDEKALNERLLLIEARTQGGALDETSQERQRSELAATRANLIDLQAQEGVAMNQLLLLLNEHPGALQQQLQYHPDSLKSDKLPALQMGIPSEVALNRPDIRAAEYKLHSATARIGVAEAELYPSITLGARIGMDTYSADNFTDWGSRSWSVGPSLNLPLFDRGRRKATVVLRETDQQQAAVDYHKTVLKAWQEIDDALSRYAAAQQKLTQQQTRADSAGQALALIQARYDGGLSNFIDVLDAQRSNIQARQALAMSQRDVMTAWAAVNRSVGNYPR